MKTLNGLNCLAKPDGRASHVCILRGSVLPGTIGANFPGSPISKLFKPAGFLRKIAASLAFLIAGLSVSSSTYGQVVSTYTASGNWVCPPGISSIQVECWGAGGAGGGVNGGNAPKAGGGGKGGGYVKNIAIPVTPGTTYTVTVGTGGVGVLGNGGSGGSSWFGSAATIFAVGGNGGIGGTDNSNGAGATTPTSGNVGNSGGFNYYGGNGANGSYSNNRGGGGGSSAGTAANGNGANNQTGGTAPTGGFAGANGYTGTGNEGPGFSATGVGAGGGGALTDDNSDYVGGNGGDGQVVITHLGQTFTSSGTFTVPANVYSIAVQNWGGGGNGGNVSSNTQGGGGGGGAYAHSMIAVNPGEVYKIVVGAGGASGGGANSGGTSTFQLNYTVTPTPLLVAAAGGAGVSANNATGGAGGNSNASTGTLKYSGGAGADGKTISPFYGGGGGASAGYFGAGTSAIDIYGALATTGGGNGGNGNYLTGVGQVGENPGGGGGGASRTSGSVTVSGGAGANGKVLITWTTCATNMTYPNGNSYCISNGTVQTPTLIGFSGGTWSVSPATGLAINSNGQFTPSSATPGVYTISNSANACGTKPVITISALPSAASVNPAVQAVCGVVSAALGGNTPAIGTGTWSKISGTSTASFSAINSGSSIATLQSPFTYGNYTYRWTITNGVCASNSADVVVTYTNPAVTATVGSALTAICQGSSSVALGGSVSAGATGTWSDGGIGGSFSSTNISTATYTPPASFTGTVTLTLTAINGPCSAQGSKTLVVNPGPLTVDPGTNAYICNNGGASYVGSTASFTGNADTYTWSSSNATGIFVAQNTLNDVLFTADAADLASGTRNLRLTVSQGTCSKFADKSILFDAAPTAIAGTASQFICSNTPTINLYEAGITSVSNNPNGVQWSTNGTNSISNSTSLTSATYAISPADIVAGSLSFTLTAKGTASCGNISGSKVYVINMQPVVNAGNTNAICNSSSNLLFAIDATAINTTGVYSWSTTGTGNLGNINSLNGVTYTPGINESGNINFTLTASGYSACANASVTKTIYIAPVPVANGGNNLTYCANLANNIDLSQAGTFVSGAASILWSSTGGTFTNPSLLNTAYTPSAAQINAGEAIVTLTAYAISPCTNTSSTKTIIIKPLPAVTVPAIADICKNGVTAGLAGSVTGSYTTATWTSSVAGGSFSDVNALNPTYTAPPNYTDSIYLTLTVMGNCTSASATRGFKVLTPPSAGPAVSAICPGSTTASLGGVFAGGYSAAWSSAAGGTFSPGPGSLNATWTAPASFSGTATLILTATNGPCINYQDSKTVQVLQPATVAIGANFTQICVNGTTPPLQGSFGGSATGFTWSEGVIGGSFSIPSDPYNTTYTSKPGYAGNSGLQLKSTGGCGTATASILFVVAAAPVVEAGPDLSTCINTSGQIITGGSSAPGAGSYNWSTIGGDGSFTNNGNLLNSSYLPGPNDKANGSVVIKLTTTGTAACAANSYSDTKTLTIDKLPIANAGSALPAICSNNVLPVNIATSASASNQSSILWSGGLDGSFSNAGSLSGATYTPGVADLAAGSVTFTLTAFGAGGCSAQSVTSTRALPVTTLPNPNFSYGYNEYWQCSANPSPLANAAITLGSIASTAGLSVNATSGLINLAGSTPGTYTITNTVPAANGCQQVSYGTSLTVYPPVAISNPVNKTQSVCLGSAISPISFNITSKTGAVTVTGLPAGVSYSFNSVTGVLNISGTAAGAGVFVYTVTVKQFALNAVQQCNSGADYTATGSITITTPPVLTLSSASSTVNQRACRFSAIAPISFILTGDVAGATSSGNLPAGLSVGLAGGVVSVSGTPTAVAGIYSFNVIATPAGTCTNASYPCTIIISEGAPVLAGPISGPSGLCPPHTNLAYSVASGSNVVDYTWTMPEAAWTIASGQGTNNLAVNVGGGASYPSSVLSVSASNGCGTTSAVNLTVLVNNYVGVSLGADFSICNSDMIPLQAVLGGSATNVTWSTTGTLGNIGNTNAINTTYTPTATDRANGSVSFTAVTNTPGGVCNTVGTDELVVTIKPVPTASIAVSGAAVLCASGTSSVGISGTPHTTVTYTKDGGATHATADLGATGTAVLNTGTISSSVTYSLTSIAFNNAPNCNSNLNSSATITVNPAAVVDAGADLTVCQSTTSTSLSGATVSGGTTLGTWTFSPAGASTGTLSITGATSNPSSVLFTHHPSFAGNVTLTLTSADPDGAGPCTAVSASRVVRVDPPLTVVAGPDIDVCMPAISTPIVLSNSSINGPAGAMAKWSTGVGNNGLLSNTNFTTTPQGITFTPENGSSNLMGLSLVLTSNTVAGNICPAVNSTRLVNVYRQVLTDAGPDQTKCGTAGVTFTLAGAVTGGANSGTWSSSGSGTFNNTNNLAAIYTPSAADITAGQVTLTLTSVDPAGPCGSVSDAMIAYINKPVTVNAQSGYTVCEAGNTLLFGQSTGAPNITWTAASGSFSNDHALTTTYYPSISSGTVNLTLTADDPDGPTGPCTGAVSNTTILVKPKPRLVTKTATQCSGSLFAFTANSTVAGSSFSWTRATVAGISNAAGSGANASISETLINTTHQSIQVLYRFTITGSGCSNLDTLTVTVSPTPAIPAQATSICGDGSFVLAPVNAVPGAAVIVPAGTTYSWPAATVSGGLTGAGAGSNQATINGTISNPTASSQIATYTVTPTAGSCSGSAFTSIVTVSPTPKIPAQTASICSGNSFTVSPVNNPPGSIAPAGITYTWSAPVISPVGAITGGSAQATGQPSISQTLANTGNSTATATYTVTPFAGTCAGTSFTVTVTVHPDPVFTINNASTSVCSGVANSVNITISSSTSGISYSWSRDANLYLSGLASGSTGTIAGSMTNSANTSQSTLFTIVPSVGTCNGAPLTTTVQVKPTPTIAANVASQTVCSGNAITQIDFSNPNSVGGTTYTWTRTNTGGSGVSGLANSGSSSISGTTTTSSTTQQSSTISAYAVAAACSSAVVQPVIIVNPSPANPGTPTVTGNNNCEDIGATFTKPSGQPAGVEWYWQTASNGVDESNSANTTKLFTSGSLWLRAKNTSTGCWSSGTGTATATLKPNPQPSVAAFYCTVPGNVLIQSTATLTPTTILWSPQNTPQNVVTKANDTVDLAGRYNVIYTYSNGCSRSNFIDVAQNLVVNGDFESGNIGFQTEYAVVTPKPPVNTCCTGLWPEGLYAVDKSAVDYHANFHGKDYTTGSGNFMIINGSTVTNPSTGKQFVIWQQTVTVQPNTDYYFSAWAMNLNPSNPAILQFEVNGVLVGTIADLNLAPKPTTEAAVARSNWVRFYSNPLWNSGSNTSVVIRIRNLNLIANGNDFGLDDIHFGTLAPNPVKIISVLGTTPVCPDSTIQFSSVISGGKAPITYTWLGPNGFSSTSPNPSIPSAIAANAGIYTLKVLDGYNCDPPATQTSNTVVVLNGSPGIWTGNSNNDWYWCKNWQDGRVPTSTTDVTIPFAATNISKIDKVASPYDKNLPAYSRNISIAKELTFGSSVDSIKTYGNLTIANSTGLINMTPGGVVALYGTNWTNDRGSAGFTPGADAASRVSFLGSQPQYITTVGSTETFYNLQVKNSSSTGLTLNSAAYVQGGFYFDQGLINTYSNPPAGSGFSPNSLGMLTLGPNSTMPGAVNKLGVGGSTSTMVNGRMAREYTTAYAKGTNEFVFPIGKTTPIPKYRPPGAWATTVSGTTTFAAEYFPYAHPVASFMGGNLLGIIKPEHWQIDRTTGTATGDIKLPYIDPGSGNWIGNANLPATNPCGTCNVAVVKKESTGMWYFTTLPPNSSDPQYRYYTNNGYIYSGPVNSFSPFSIGYSYSVILPVNLLAFDGKLQQNDGWLQWSIVHDKDLAQFELEYSTDGIHFGRLATLLPNGTNYSYLHHSLPVGTNYYRLLILDKNGTKQYSKTVLLYAGAAITFVKGLQFNPVHHEAIVNIFSASNQNVRGRILDMKGRVMGEWTSNLPAGYGQLHITTSYLAAGMYHIHIQTADGVSATLKMMKD